MSTRQIGFLASIVLALAAAACGSGTTGNGTTGGGGTTGGAATNTITISAFTFSPDTITVAAGSTVTVVNNDTAAHTATSEASASAYTNAAAAGGFTFDTGQIKPGTSATITVPAGLASGSSQPYFCSNHLSMMTNPNPVIKIQ